ncbi:MAG TPA: tRNA 2-selenouridine(34) synthase MnmH [Puia sp.]|uniref:tRNA 2-selenouridine(34) synthase MnmH n=1 Tax=Puia sp. TaxID=2045100 RepID=UPI002CACFD3D|nr:tRNA 2-selenouridine(34) synthase MnmH [Puia sp.]HVU99557.1 tRNA 2-selenouridine(34) synthase MnmH [Puia sp.]
MTRRYTIDQLLTGLPVPIVDVRTPAEFTHGHIPGAVNIPLFTNEERVTVGTTYKQQGREAAILLGFDLTGSKWSAFIRQALELAPEKKVAVHCWRGGMRSAAMAWALDLYGFDVSLIQGGYKQYRRWVLKRMEQPWEFRVIGGMTGSGKTAILKQLAKQGEQTVDLEDLAQHQGSTYGTLNRLIQPTQEQFENDLASRLSTLDATRPIWIEDESQNIGRCILAKPFYTRMREAAIFDLQVPLDQRIAALEQEYGNLDRSFLIECTERITKRLGPEQTRNAIAAIREGRIPDFIRQVLVYYDKAYRKGLKFRDTARIVELPLDTHDPLQNTARLLAAARSLTTTTTI